LDECRVSPIGEHAARRWRARMTAYGTFNHNLTLVGISRTYCHAAAWSGEMSPKNRKSAPGTGNAGLGHDIHSDQYLRTAWAGVGSSHMAPERCGQGQSPHARRTGQQRPRPFQAAIRLGSRGWSAILRAAFSPGGAESGAIPRAAKKRPWGPASRMCVARPCAHNRRPKRLIPRAGTHSFIKRP
jgi:hypothetical protein